MDATAIEQAGETLFDQVYVPAYMQKCAARGITFQDEDELRMALQSTHLLRSKEAQETAETSSNLHKAANVALRGAFGEDVEASEKEAQAANEAALVGQELGQDEGVQKAAAVLSQLTAEN